MNQSGQPVCYLYLIMAGLNHELCVRSESGQQIRSKSSPTPNKSAKTFSKCHIYLSNYYVARTHCTDTVTIHRYMANS